MLKKLGILLVCALVVVYLIGLDGSAANAAADRPNFTSNLVIVDSPEDIPEEAILVSSNEVFDCATETMWQTTAPAVPGSNHQEYRYKRDISGTLEISHQEWSVEERERTVTAWEFQKYNYNGKYPYGKWHLVPGGLTWNGSHIGEGVWYQGNPNTGSYFKQEATGNVQYSPWSEWVETQWGLTEEPTVPANTDTHEYRVEGPVTVVDAPTVEGYTEYYVLGGAPSRNAEDASWVHSNPSLPSTDRSTQSYESSNGWQQFDERTVTDVEGTLEVVTYYVYNDGKTCDVPGGVEKPTKSTSKTVECLGGALVTKTTDAQGNITKSIVNGSESCSQTDDSGEFIQEEGM